jgi:hypothetical protein
LAENAGWHMPTTLSVDEGAAAQQGRKSERPQGYGVAACAACRQTEPTMRLTQTGLALQTRSLFHEEMFYRPRRNALKTIENLNSRLRSGAR